MTSPLMVRQAHHQLIPQEFETVLPRPRMFSPPRLRHRTLYIQAGLRVSIPYPGVLPHFSLMVVRVL